MRGAKFTLFTAALTLAGSACLQGDTNTHKKTSTGTHQVARTPVSALAAKALTARAGGIALSVDATGTPRFIRSVTKHPAATGASPQKAARAYIQRFAAAYGVSDQALNTLRVVRTHDTKRGGIIVVLRQQVAGLDVYRADIKVLMRRNLELVAISGAPVAGVSPSTQLRPDAFRTQPAGALAGVLTQHFKVPVVASWAKNLRRDSHGYYKMDLVKGAPVTLSRSARAKKVMFPVKGTLVPSWYVEFFASDRVSTDSDAFLYVVAGTDGRVLHEKNLTAHDAFSYRVWADPSTLRPLDGPLEDYTPHPSSSPDGVVPGGTSPALVSVDGLNTNPIGSSDPWLASDATYTRGNNADAYSDYEAPDGFNVGDLRADLTSANAFDRIYDIDDMPLATEDQSKASVLHAFYVVNWLHDWFYDSGFNESAGNGQTDNFGRGGQGEDELHIQVQDSYNDGQRSNANMSTPGDGSSPRMQIYVWAADSTTTLAVSSDPNPVNSNDAAFGPANFDITGSITIVDDGTDTTTDACESLTNDLTGAIAFIDRGGCTFATKIQNAQDAGAIGALIANNMAGGPAMHMGGSSGAVTIGALSLGTADGIALKAAVEAGVVTTTLSKVSGVEPDGGLDSTLIAHEWGHYIHNRLADCGSVQCRGMGEGWGDFIALYLVLRQGDDRTGAYGSASYSASGFADIWFGTRRTAYSTDLSKDGLMFRHIANGESLPSSNFNGFSSANNAEVHNTGEVWATLMWEAYNALIDDRLTRGDTFAIAERAMGDYIVAGLQMTPIDATFTEARDAILAAATAANEADALAMATAFASRGAGSCAISPPRYNQDNVGVTESNELKPRMIVGSITLTGDRDCDADGVIDAAESGKVNVTIANGSLAEMTNTQVIVESTTPGVRIVDGSVNIASLGAYASTSLQFSVEMDANLAPLAILELSVTASNGEACEATTTQSLISRINSDDVLETSATDKVEATTTAWARQGTNPEDVWNIADADPTDHFWHGRDWGSPSDTSLESPDLKVNASGSLVVSFAHRYRFEADSQDGTGTNWDGAVIEISTDGGENWNDVTDYSVDPGYAGTITGQSGNSLAGRSALVATSPSWPESATTTLDFGTQFAGQTIRLRFRIGTDAGVGDDGWDIDDISFVGISNTPFSELKPNAGVACGFAVDAGPDLVVQSGATAVLRAHTEVASAAPLTFAWTQDSGTSVDLWQAETDVATFTAPEVDEPIMLSFSITMNDATTTGTDTVNVMVVPRTEDDDGTAANGCQTGSNSGGGLSMLAILLGALLVGRRRRRS